jgi:hypothetical protein
MKLVVDKIPMCCAECLFSRKGANVEEKEYKCFCSLLKAERTIYEWETIKDCPLIECKMILHMRKNND